MTRPVPVLAYASSGNRHTQRASLNLFSRNAYQYRAAEQTIAAMLATHAASALIIADRQRQFQQALASRDLIGQAKGIIMERYTIDAERAFDLIVQLSQEQNTPVRILAHRIVDTTPGRPGSAPFVPNGQASRD